MKETRPLYFIRSMNPMYRRRLVFVTLVLAVAAEAAQCASTPFESGAKPIDAICAEFNGFDQNRDGAIEIQELHRIGGAGESGPRVLMLVEKRLLEPLAGSAAMQLLTQRWADDLSAEGYCADVVAVTLAESRLHQDGRFVLAIREFLRAA